MTTTQFLALIGLIKNETAPNGNTKTRIGDTILESSKQANTYSTDETVIGTWIDGKPIYRRVYDGSQELNEPLFFNLDSVLGSEFPIESLVSMNGNIRRSDNSESYGLNNVFPNNNVSGDVSGLLAGFGTFTFISLEGKNAIMEYWNTSFDEVNTLKNGLPFNYTLIIEYTKTTDSIPE
jgi:hypothetical protein